MNPTPDAQNRIKSLREHIGAAISLLDKQLITLKSTRSELRIGSTEDIQNTNALEVMDQIAGDLEDAAGGMTAASQCVQDAIRKAQEILQDKQPSTPSKGK